MSYIPHTPEDLNKILSTIGIPNIDALFRSFGEKGAVFPHGALHTNRLSEKEVEDILNSLANKNIVYKPKNIFLGAGVYSHYIPSALESIVSRQEFYTAYTPYQPELSQGTLRAVFEFQTAISELLRQDIVNASMYDGATASAEAILMAYKKFRERKKTVLLAETLHFEYKAVIENYLTSYGINIRYIPSNDGIISLNAVKQLYNEDVFALLIQYPNFFGIIEENIRDILDFTSSKDIKSISLTIDGTVLPLLTAPGTLGFDISVLEIQSFGNPMAYGGPHAGVIATSKDLLRNLPGRIVGKTEDVNGQEAFVLTLSTREQHIRREKATSNICTNQALVALRTIVYLSLMGRKGLETVAKNSYKNAHYLAKLLTENKITLYFPTKKFYNEFLIKTQKAKYLVAELKKYGILAGYPLEEGLLVATTELNTKDSIENYIELLLRAGL